MVAPQRIAALARLMRFQMVFRFAVRVPSNHLSGPCTSVLSRVATNNVSLTHLFYVVEDCVAEKARRPTVRVCSIMLLMLCYMYVVSFFRRTLRAPQERLPIQQTFQSSIYTPIEYGQTHPVITLKMQHQSIQTTQVTKQLRLEVAGSVNSTIRVMILLRQRRARCPLLPADTIIPRVEEVILRDLLPMLLLAP